MTPFRYLLRSLLHYRFAYLGVLAGAVLGATVLLGALFAGDSVKLSLRKIAADRTGRATHVLAGGERFFRAALADDLATATGARIAPALLARGTATHATTRAGINRVQLVGVTDAFWQLAPQPGSVPLARAGAPVAINETLARRLSIGKGDTLIVRFQKPGVLAGSAPVAGAESSLQTIRCTVAAVIGAEQFGRFNLEHTQVAQPSVFLPIKLLQENLEQPDRANLLVIDAANARGDLRASLAAAVQLADYGLRLRWIESATQFELISTRVFLDSAVVAAVTGALPATQPVVSYLVNEFRAGERTTPYSIATAATHAAAPFLPADLGAREIVLNDWLAEDLAARSGDEVRLAFFQSGPHGALVEQHATFRVRAIVPLQGLAADKSWMPELPGITDTQNQSDWDPGLPLDLNRIREKDEKYWDDHRGAPKAFLSLAAGREIWSTRWGNTTALRIPFERAREAELVTTIQRALRPEMGQLLLRDFRAGAEQSAAATVDFGGLFLGMSFFLILAALGLVAMLFQLSLLQRNREDALLGAVGIPARTLLRRRLAEAAVLLVVAGALAVPLAAAYTRAILRFLETIWASQSGEATFVFAAQPQSIAIGGGVFLALSLGAIWLAIRRQQRRALSIRLAAQAEESGPSETLRRRSRLVAIIAAVIAALALGLAGRAIPAQGAFYLAGFALLAAGIAFCRARFAAPVPASTEAALDPRRLAELNLRARRSRSLTVIGLIATAVFMVLSVASFRKHVGDDWLERASGTGGFAFWIETSSPLNPGRDGRGQFEIFEASAADLGEIVPLRLGIGDNANCFNLNTTAQPQLLALDAAKLAARGAFSPNVARVGRGGTAWTALSSVTAAGAIPALVDETTLLWALKRKVGDVLNYTDETGAPFQIEIVGTLTDSLFQGYVLIDETLFLKKFPSNAGYSAFLVDARSRDAAALTALRNKLETASRDAGGRVELTRDVLAAFHQIENTYIAIFNVLGSLGVLLGSLGLAIVVARNLRERRGEFAMMSALGIARGTMGRMVFAEFARLVLWGIAIGGVASLVAILPNLAALPPAPTLLLVGSLLAGIVVLNLASGFAIFRWSMRDLRPSVALSGL